MLHGVDPSSSWIGLASLDAAPGEAPARPPALVLLTACRPLPTLARTVRERLAVLSWSPGDAVAIEQPPPAARAARGHGRQAPIGHAIGLYAGLVWGTLAAAGYDGVEHQPGPREWRAAMLRWSAVWGHPLLHAKDLLASRAARAVAVAAQTGEGRVDRIQRLPGGRDLYVSFVGCGHHWSGPADDIRVIPTACPECSRRPPTEAEDPNAIGLAWKEIACEFVAHHWPGPFAALLAAAHFRATQVRPDRAPHTYQGVADACEAVGIACSLLGHPV